MNINTYQVNSKMNSSKIEMNKINSFNVLEVLTKNRSSNKVCLVYNDRKITYIELYNTARLFSKRIETEKKYVTIYISNSIDYVIAFFSTLFAGKSALLINASYPVDEVYRIMEKADSQLIITSNEKTSLLNTKTCNILLIEDRVYSEEVNTEYFEVPISDDDVAILIPTSGTFGDAKLVPLTHKNIMCNVDDILFSYTELRDDDRELIILPMTGVFCNTTQLLVPLWMGLTVYIWGGKLIPSSILKYISDEKITYCQMVPSILRIFATLIQQKKYDLSNMKRITIGGEPISKEEIIRIQEKVGHIVILQGYGMTETSPVISSQRYDDLIKKPSSSGKIMYHVQLKTIPEQGGLIYVQGPSVFNGYLNGDNPVDEEGWFNTGDIGYVDEDGELNIIGREKNIIISCGQNVYPEEVEGVLLSHPSVKGALVYGEEDETIGELVASKVVLWSNELTDVSILKEFCLLYLPSYKVPEVIELVNELEKTYTSKIKRK